MSQAPPDRIEQLKRALELGAIDHETFDAAVAGITAQLAGSGAIAQGQDALAVGAGGVAFRGDNQGLINLGVLIQQGTQPGASRDDLRRAYLARIVTQADRLPLLTGETGKAQVRLSAVYTALLTRRGESDLAGEQAKAEPVRAERETRRLSALEVLNAERRLVLLGGPGSGKSAFVNFVALSMAGELLGLDVPNLAALTAPLPREAREGGEEGEPKPQRWDHGALLPVQVVLRDLASQLPAPGTPMMAEAVWNFICKRLTQAALDGFAPFLHWELIEHGGLILLDGLDEVPDALDRREQIKQAVQDFAASFTRCRFLVTSRTYAYQRDDWKLVDFAEVHLLPFTSGQIERFVDAWYGHMAKLERLSERLAVERAEVLKRAAARNRHVRELAEYPLLLTLIAKVQTEKGGDLPEKREELYDKAVELLLNQWESMKVVVREDGTKEVEPSLAEWLNASRDDIRRRLNRLAFEAHRDQPKLTGTADIRQGDLIDALLGASANRADVKVKRLEEYLRDRAGILAAHDIRTYQFPHRSFQEYLAACHLTDDEFPDQLAGLARGDPNRWREVALLAAAKAARGSSLNAWALSEALCFAPLPGGSPAAADHWGGLLAGRVLVECADLAKIAPRNAEKLTRVRDWQLAILRGKTLPATDRALAGRTLAMLGDPRPEVMTLDGMQFCHVPPGPFVMGDDDGSSDEKPQHTVDLDYPFFMGRFPVTVAQWCDYICRSGRDADDERSLRGRPNDPVGLVSWHDAMRFCDFLTGAWKDWLPAGFVVTLPSEAEWEKAARGGQSVFADPDWAEADRIREALDDAGKCALVPNPIPARAYPWGDSFDPENANAESAVGETSAVGGYPAGSSPYGCQDMSGNVWEWTRSLWDSASLKREFVYPYDPYDAEREALGAGSNIWRVVRGGSFRNLHGYARCACRYWSHPDFRLDLSGFRVVVLCSSPVR
jgi:formylglycine-generating enzyme required for sulfatase activity